MQIAGMPQIVSKVTSQSGFQHLASKLRLWQLSDGSHFPRGIDTLVFIYK